MADKTGFYAFLFGLVVAVLLAFAPAVLGSWGIVLLVVIGLVAGALNITQSESTAFLIAVIGLPLVTGALGLLPAVDAIVGPLFDNIAVFAGGMATPVILSVFWHRGHKK